MTQCGKLLLFKSINGNSMILFQLGRVHCGKRVGLVSVRVYIDRPAGDQQPRSACVLAHR